MQDSVQRKVNWLILMQPVQNGNRHRGSCMYDYDMKIRFFYQSSVR